MEISKMGFLHRVPPQMCIIMTSSKGRALYSLEGSMAARVSLALQVNFLRAGWGVTTLRACRAGGPSGSEASGWYRIRSGRVGSEQNVKGPASQLQPTASMWKCVPSLAGSTNF